MFTLVLGMIILAAVVGILTIPLPEQLRGVKFVASGAAVVAAFAIMASGALSYNDAGYCTHVRTVTGSEVAKCDIGWYFSGWGESTQYPHYITISHTSEPTEGSVSDLPPYKVRMSDNWTGDVSQTTRFGIPQDSVQFLKMARDFRSPERLIVTLLRPAVTASLDSVANLYSMEEYWSGGKRDEFKTEFEQAVQKGRPAIDRFDEIVSGPTNNQDVTASDSSEFLEDDAATGNGNRVRVITKKRLNANGEEIRIPHDYLEYGITAASAIVEQIDPDVTFEERTLKRKEAASRRIIAREERLEQEEQRLLAITKAERDIAERQGQARVDQIEQTTNAETQKKLALVRSEQEKEQARVAQQTAEINLQKAKIEAESLRVTADAQAYERERLLEADNALQKKLDAEIAIQKVWAEAYARRNVPQIVMGAGENGAPVGSDSEVKNLLDLLTADTAKRLAYDRKLSQ